MKKKIALALIGTMIAATMATGCSGDKKDPSDKDSTTSTESVKDDSSNTESSTSTEETVDISVLYEKSEYEDASRKWLKDNCWCRQESEVHPA